MISNQFVMQFALKIIQAIIGIKIICKFLTAMFKKTKNYHCAPVTQFVGTHRMNGGPSRLQAKNWAYCVEPPTKKKQYAANRCHECYVSFLRNNFLKNVIFI